MRIWRMMIPRQDLHLMMSRSLLMYVMAGVWSSKIPTIVVSHRCSGKVPFAGVIAWSSTFRYENHMI